MNTNNLLDEILTMLRRLKDNRKQLEQLYQYMLKEIYIEEDASETIYVPERFVSLVKEVADSLSAGLVCYINPDTLEIINMPKSVMDNMMFEDEEEDGAEETQGEEEDPFYRDLKRIDRDWKQTITIEPPESHESFSFMEQFVDSLPESPLSKLLSEALAGRKPFRRFNNIIHQSLEREGWFVFRHKCLVNYVAGILSYQLWNDESGEHNLGR